MLRWKRNYSSRRIPYKSGPVKYVVNKQARRQRRGRTSTTGQVTNKGDMQIRIPKSSPKPAIGRACLASNATKAVGTLYAHRIGSDILKGTDVGSRQGDKVRILGYNVRMQVYNNNVAEADHGRVRCICALDLTPNLGTGIDMFMSEGTTNTPVDFGTGPNSLRLLKVINHQRYKVLFDKTFQCPITNNPVQNQAFINEYIPLNHLMTFNNNAPLVSGIDPCIRFIYFFENEANLAFTINPVVKIYDITHFSN